MMAKKIRIVLVDSDERYLMPLEYKIIEQFGDNGDIHVITDIDYFSTFFGKPQSIDILIINEELYDRSIERHDIDNLFILLEVPNDEEETGNLSANKIYKYSSVKQIFNVIIDQVKNNNTVSFPKSFETKVVMVYSPIGGIGKTTIAAGISSVLANNHKKVLFIGTDNLQTFGCIMRSDSKLKAGTESSIIAKSEYLYDVIKPRIVEEDFDILPPFTSALSSLNIKMEEYIHLINCIRDAKEYDFIIVDCATDFSEATSKLMSNASQTLIVTGQDDVSAHKLDCLLKNIDSSDQNRFYFVCNRYKQEEKNCLVTEDYINKCRVREYVNYESDNEMLTIDNLFNIESIQKIGLMLL